MKKQKICIIGGSLTGLVTAISLSKLNFEIDLITGNFVNNSKSSRTITVSENNFHFLNKLNISRLLKTFGVQTPKHAATRVAEEAGGEGRSQPGLEVLNDARALGPITERRFMYR